MPMEIYFSKHALERYAERMNKIDHTNIEHDDIEERDLVKKGKLKKEIIRRGKFKKDKTRENGFYCIVGNLKVYAGYQYRDDLIITTCFPYKKSMGKFYKTLDTIDFSWNENKNGKNI